MSKNAPGSRLVSIKIDFYSENQASIDVGFKDAPDELELLHFFLMFFAKVLSSLGPGEYSNQLLRIVSEAILGLVQNSTYITEPPRDLKVFEDVQLVAASEAPEKTYLAEFNEYSGGRLIQTSFAFGDENNYAPRSVLVVMQYLLNNLSYYSVVYLLTALRFFLEYYRQEGCLAPSQSPVESVAHAINQANQAVARNDA